MPLTRLAAFLIVFRWVETPEPLGEPRSPVGNPFILAQEPHRVLTNVHGGRSTGTNPLAHSPPLEGLLHQNQDDDVLLVAEPVVVGELRHAKPSRCKIIRMKSQGTRGTNARLLPCLCVPGVFSHRTSPGASIRKSNRNRILSDSDSFILVVRFAAGRARPRASMQSAATRAQVGITHDAKRAQVSIIHAATRAQVSTNHAATRAQVNEQRCDRASKVQRHERKEHHT